MSYWEARTKLLVSDVLLDWLVKVECSTVRLHSKLIHSKVTQNRSVT